MQRATSAWKRTWTDKKRVLMDKINSGKITFDDAEKSMIKLLGLRVDFVEKEEEAEDNFFESLSMITPVGKFNNNKFSTMYRPLQPTSSQQSSSQVSMRRSIGNSSSHSVRPSVPNNGAVRSQMPSPSHAYTKRLSTSNIPSLKRMKIADTCSMTAMQQHNSAIAGISENLVHLVRNQNDLNRVIEQLLRQFIDVMHNLVTVISTHFAVPSNQLVDLGDEMPPADLGDDGDIYDDIEIEDQEDYNEYLSSVRNERKGKK